MVGDFFVDLQAQVPRLPFWGGDVATPAIEILPGGSAANTARQLHRLLGAGSEVVFFSTTGDDALGQTALAMLDSEGFNTANIKRLAKPSSGCIVLSGPEDRGFVSCYSTVHALSTETIDEAALLSCAHIHVGGYLGLKGLHTAAFTELMQRCREGGATLSVGTQSAPDGQWAGQNDHLATLIPLVDFLFVNETELTNIRTTLKLPLEELAPQLTVVETQGSIGTRVWLPGSESRQVPSLLVDKPVDMNGAGDAFAAGCLSRLLSESFTGVQDKMEAAVWGNACASCNVMRFGACSTPIPIVEVQVAFQTLQKQIAEIHES